MTAYRKKQLIYIVTDALSAVAVWLCFLLFRWLIYEGKVFGVDSILIPAFSFWRPLVLYPIGCLCVYYLSGYYLRPFHKRYGQELRTTIISSAIIALTAFFFIVIDDPVAHYNRYLWSLAVLFGLQWLLCYVPRLIITTLSRSKHEEAEYVRIDHFKGEEDLYEQIARLYPTGKEIYVTPRLLDIVTGAAHIGELNDNPYICVTEQHMSDAELCIKRAADIVLSTTMMVVLSPLYIALALTVKCSSKGPIIYRQERIGLHGLPFTILKFRTMEDSAEDGIPQLASENDPRITPVGHFLRKYRLDELPQFWNIIRGDMSLVGPRPERAYFIRQIEQQAPYYCLIYKIKPGLTSWGPIKVGYTDTMDKMIERLKYDIAYMENMSLTLDIKILLRTFRVILDGKGK